MVQTNEGLVDLSVGLVEGNPYFSGFCELVPDWKKSRLSREPTGSCYPDRRALVERYAWAVPSPEAIEVVAALSPLVEIGAGTGYWAKLLADAGADIVAYDIAPLHYCKGNHWHPEAQTYFPVRRGGAMAASRHPDRTLFLCWPPYVLQMAANALRSYRGGRFAYIGESQGGCNATDGFFEAVKADWNEALCLDLPQWSGIHDALWVYERKELQGLQ